MSTLNNPQTKSLPQLHDLIEAWVRSGKFKYDFWLVPPRDGYWAQVRPFNSRFKGPKKEFFCIVYQTHVDVLYCYLDNKPILMPLYATDPHFFDKLEGYLQSWKDCPD